jgi:CPA2 family monovalent cation:H+ antiporter-2
MDGEGVPYLPEVVAFLVASVIIVPLARWLKVSPILGYLLIGAAIGPHGLGVVGEPEGVRRLAELGVVFLLFTIGIELSYTRLKAMRAYVFGVGGLQVVLTAAAIGFIAWRWDNRPEAAVVIGGALALSSTAIVVQLLIEREAIATRFGRVSFGVLLFQDLAVVPLLVLLQLFGGGGEGPLWTLLVGAFARGLAAVGLIVIVGRFLVRHLFRVVAWTKSSDVLMAMTLLAILATALGTAEAGLSMALGAFLAGLLLAETEYRHQVESDIKPFRGMLLGLFFISVGMGIDFTQVADKFALLALSILGLLLIKGALVGVAVLAAGLGREVALRAALLLAGSGEFAFVILNTAAMKGVIAPDIAQFMTVVAGFTMLVIPVLDIVGARIGRLLAHREARAVHDKAIEGIHDLEGHVVIAGYGRVGQTVARILRERNIPYVALDLDANVTVKHWLAREPVFYGDAGRADVLEQVGIARAAAAVITVNDYAATVRALETITRHWPSVPVFVRARDATHHLELSAFNPKVVVPETLEGSLQLSGQVLRALGTPAEAVNALIDRIRREGYSGYGEQADVAPAPESAAEKKA